MIRLLFAISPPMIIPITIPSLAFRKRFLSELNPLFVQILLIAQQMGCLKLGKVSLDGTKIKANASKHRALSWQYACKLEAQLKAEVEELLRQAEDADCAGSARGVGHP